MTVERRFAIPPSSAFSCSSRLRNERVDRNVVSYLASNDGRATMSFCLPSADGNSIQRTVSGVFPTYSYFFANEDSFNAFYDSVSVPIPSATQSGEEAKADRAGKDAAGLSGFAQASGPAGGKKTDGFEYFRGEEVSDFLVSNLIYMLEGKDALYFSDSGKNCLAWLEALLSSLPVSIANRISYSMGESLQTMPLDHKFDLVFLDNSDKELVTRIRCLDKTVAIGPSCFFPDKDCVSPNRGYYLAIKERGEDLRLFNEFMDEGSYAKLSLELAEIYDMFVYLFRTEPLSWTYDKLLTHANLYYRLFPDHPRSEWLAKEILDFFIYSYGDPCDEEFIKGFLECLDEDNLRIFLSAAVRKKKKSSAYSLLYDVLSDCIFSFSKRKSIPLDIRSLLIEYSKEVNRTPDNILLIDFLGGLDDYSVAQLKEHLIALHNDGFSYFSIKFFNSIERLGSAIKSIVGMDSLECDALFVSSFFPPSSMPEKQLDFSEMVFDEMLSRMEGRSVLSIRKELAGMFAMMRDDNFYFSDDGDFDKTERLKALRKGLFRSLGKRFPGLIARFILSGAICESGSFRSIPDRIGSFFTAG